MTKSGSKKHDGLLHGRKDRETITPDMSAPANTLIYTRVSTTEQAENRQSLDMQEKACRDYADRHDFVVDQVFREEGESAKTADRTKLLQMIKYCQENKGRLKYVLVWKVDRFARRTEDHVTLRALLLKLGIQLLSATEPIENSNTGKLMETILAGFAEFDNGVRSERSSNGMKARLAEGGWVHAAPIGYRNVKDLLKRPTLEPDDMAPKVQNLLKEVATGAYTKQQSVVLAHQLGIRSKAGNLVAPNTVYKMITNPVYAGLIKGKMVDGVRPGLHAALITQDELQAIEDALAGRKRTIRPPNRSNPEWPLRQFVRCPKCNRPMTGSTSRGRSGMYPYYHCVNYKHGAKNYPREKMHDDFEALLEQVRPASHTLALFREIALRRWHQQYQTELEKRRQIEIHIAKLADSRAKLIDRSIENLDHDPELLATQLERIQVKRAELEIERGEIKETEAEKEAIVDLAVQFIANAAHLWRVSSPDDRQRFQKMVYPDGIPYFSETGFGTAVMGLCYEEIRHIEAIKQKEATVAGASSGKNNILVVPRGVEPRLTE